MKNKLSKSIILLICILLFSAMTGCSGKRSQSTQSEAFIERTTISNCDSTGPIVPTFSTPLCAELLKAEENKEYKIIDAVFEQYPDMHYPQLVNLQDESSELETNQLILDQLTTIISALGWLEEYENAKDIEAEISVMYEVEIFNESFLSVKYILMYSNRIMAYPKVHCFTLNLDVEKNQYIYLEDMVIVNSAFWKEFQSTAKCIDLADSLSEEDAWLGAYYPPQTSEGVVQLKFCDCTDLEQNTYEIFSYYKDRKLYLCFPKEHILGSYGIFEFNLDL